ncbi:MAG: hypothetical protein ABIP93_17205 [Gemmatimonadaceae bacterium]
MTPAALQMLRRATLAARGAVSASAASRRRQILVRTLRLGLVLGFISVLAVVTIWSFTDEGVRAFMVHLGQSTGVIGGVPRQTERGIAAYDSGNVALAERELDQAAQRYRRSALALVYLARIRAEAGDDARAGQLLSEAVAREPANAAAHRMLGELHLTRARRLVVGKARPRATSSELTAADTNFARAIELDPADRRTRGFHGCVLGMLGRADEARDALAAAGSGPWDDCVSNRAP